MNKSVVPECLHNSIQATVSKDTIEATSRTLDQAGEGMRLKKPPVKFSSYSFNVSLSQALESSGNGAAQVG